ncbi:MAG: phosphoribosylformylglycinamidine synthase subunit PurL [Deltaproteobacteria bacterium]|nr:phosphoribosylformylglycinamidine synthase subunit PurL [Deltaproteobacteria bacterium]
MGDPPITKALIEAHGLTGEEYARILALLGREPTYTELGIFSVMWSEHCSYKSSRVHLRRLPSSGPHVVQGPGENAGVVDIGDGLVAVFKMESHNHPSFIEPYQGAATGVGGILRDIFTMGARPIACLDSLRFGDPALPRTRYLVRGVVAGIAGYGNCMGIPTVGGECSFHECYNGNILVNVFCVGVAPRDRVFLGRAAGVGNPVIYVGSRTGRDGIHGATMASEEFDAGEEGPRTTVQVGDPFTEKLLLEACLELMSTDCLVGIQDMGAAGLTSSSVEMAGRGSVGVELDLDQVPLREPGMSPYEIMLSESQERMLLVARAGREAEVEAIFRKWDLQVAVVGRVIAEPLLRVRHGGAVVAEVAIDPLTRGAPSYERPAARPAYLERVARLSAAEVALPGDLGGTLLMLLGSPNLADKRWVFRQYDHMVGTNTVVLPGADAALLRVKGTRRGLALAVDGNHRFCYLDPRRGAALAVAEAARNVVCLGAKPLGVTDCLNFGSPENPEIMWQFSEVVDGIAEGCRELGLPVVSGNVSFYNETSGVPIYPTPTIAVLGLLEDVSGHAARGFCQEGDPVLLLGETREELGGSEYLKAVHGLEAGGPPRLAWDLERAVQQTCREALARGLVRPAHDCAEGGLGVALAECTFGSGLGARVRLTEGIRPDALLFGESASRIVLSVPEAHAGEVEALARVQGAPCQAIGRVGGDRLVIEGLVDVPVSACREAWARGLERQVLHV